MTVAVDTIFVQLWFLFAIQSHDTITTACNKLATVSIPTWTRLLHLQLLLRIADSAKTVNRSAQTIKFFTWLHAQYTKAISTLHGHVHVGKVNSLRGRCIKRLQEINTPTRVHLRVCPCVNYYHKGCTYWILLAIRVHGTLQGHRLVRPKSTTYFSIWLGKDRSLYWSNGKDRHISWTVHNDNRTIHANSW